LISWQTTRGEIADAIYEVERQKAKERMGEGGEGRHNCADLPTSKTTAEVADRIGIGSGRTYGKAKEREEWASDETPTHNCVEGRETNDEVADRIGIGSGARPIPSHMYHLVRRVP